MLRYVTHNCIINFVEGLFPLASGALWVYFFTQICYPNNCKLFQIIPGGSQTGTGANNMIFAKDRFCGLALGFCGATATGASSCSQTVGPVISEL